MGLRDEIQTDLSDAFDNDLSDAVQEFTGSRTISDPESYDPKTGNQTSSDIRYLGRGVFTEYGIKEIDDKNILRTDNKLIALQNEVADTPAIDDRINAAFRVINVNQDPASASWVIQLRKM